MSKNLKNIIREKLIRKIIKQKELFSKILKSIRQNNNICNNIKNYSTIQIKKLNNKRGVLTKQNKICFYTGKRGGVLRGLNFSRYTAKTFIIENKLTNIKKNN